MRVRWFMNCDYLTIVARVVYRSTELTTKSPVHWLDTKDRCYIVCIARMKAGHACPRPGSGKGSALRCGC